MGCIDTKPQVREVKIDSPTHQELPQHPQPHSEHLHQSPPHNHHQPSPHHNHPPPDSSPHPHHASPERPQQPQSTAERPHEYHSPQREDMREYHRKEEERRTEERKQVEKMAQGINNWGIDQQDIEVGVNGGRMAEPAPVSTVLNVQVVDYEVRREAEWGGEQRQKAYVVEQQEVRSEGGCNFAPAVRNINFHIQIS